MDFVRKLNMNKIVFIHYLLQTDVPGKPDSDTTMLREYTNRTFPSINSHKGYSGKQGFSDY